MKNICIVLEGYLVQNCDLEDWGDYRITLRTTLPKDGFRVLAVGKIDAASFAVTNFSIS